jgi:transposase
LPISGGIMEIIKNKVCGADIHKKFLVATILSRDGTQISERFGMMLDDILKFKEWVIANNCEQVAIESTGVYWVPIYTALEDKIEVIVANPYQIKHTPGRKTDKVDSEWIAELCLKGMIEPSRIFPKEDRELRTLTRARENLVNNRTQMKNRIHQILEYSCIKISSVLTDIFGKSGRYLLDGLLEGKSIDEILIGTKSKTIRKNEKQLREAIKNSLDPAQILVIRYYLEQMEEIQKKIDNLDIEIMSRIKSKKEDLEIAMSIPGIAFTSASSILAEIGNYRDFENGNKLAAWCGLVPSIYESANKRITGSITKQGSKHVRRMLVQVAHAISRTKNSKLKSFFLRIKAKKGSKVAIVALARKVLCILHHLLVNREMYEETVGLKPKSLKFDRTSSPIQITEQDMIDALIKAGYIVKKMDKGGRSGGGYSTPLS